MRWILASALVALALLMAAVAWTTRYKVVYCGQLLCYVQDRWTGSVQARVVEVVERQGVSR